VVVENIYRHMEQGATPMEAALKGSGEIGFTVVSISLSLIAVFLPLLLLGGIVGRLFREFSVTVSAAILVSMVISLTLTPMLSSRSCGRSPRITARSFHASRAPSRRWSTPMAVASTSCCATGSRPCWSSSARWR